MRIIGYRLIYIYIYIYRSSWSPEGKLTMAVRQSCSWPRTRGLRCLTDLLLGKRLSKRRPRDAKLLGLWAVSASFAPDVFCLVISLRIPMVSPHIYQSCANFSEIPRVERHANAVANAPRIAQMLNWAGFTRLAVEICVKIYWLDAAYSIGRCKSIEWYWMYHNVSNKTFPEVRNGVYSRTDVNLPSDPLSSSSASR